MSSPETLVTDAFDNAQTFATETMDLVSSYLDAFASNLYVAPLIDVVWTGVVAPTVETIPDVPTFDAPSFTMPTAPDALVIDAPDISISSFGDVAPAVDLSAMPVLAFGDKPDVSIGDAPVVYSVADVSLPDAPMLDDVTAPDLLALTTPTFDGLDLHSSFLDDINSDLPTLTLVAPTAYSYTPGAAYTSSLKTALSASILSRQAGGTGLPTGVETAIWGRGADRESATAQADIDDATEANEALGWSLPQGAVASAIRKAQQNKRNRIADLSREVSIEQAKLEQTNIQKAIDQGLQWEGQLIEYSLSLEKITFESAKVAAQNSIDIHNAGLERFKALYQGIAIRINLYDAIIKGELAKVDVYRAEIAGEQAKADANRTLIEQYKAQIEARLAVVRVYEARLGAARTLVEIEKTKVEASAEAIRGFIASVNSKTAQMEVYKTGVFAEQVKSEAWKTNVQGQAVAVDAYRAKADAFRAKAGAEEASAKAQLARFEGLWRAKEAEFHGFTAQVEAERARAQSATEIARAILAAYEANTRAVEVKANQNSRLFEARIKEYEAQTTYTLNGQKINSDIIAHNRQVQLDASKAIAQVAAQLASSAMAQAHAEAHINGSSGTSVQYNYSNSTATAPASVTTA